MPGQYWGAKRGAHAEQDYYLAEYRQFLAADARRRMPLATYNSNNVYPKGALVLEMLKTQLGPERFWASIRRYLTRHAYGNATSDDLRQAVLDATGQSLGWFWSQWIYSAGYPEFAVTSAYDSAARRAHAHGAADPGGHRHGGQHRPPLRARRSRFGRRSPSGSAPRRATCVRRVTIDRREQTVRHRRAARPADHGRVRRRQRDGQDAGLRPAHRVAGGAARRGTRISGSAPGPSSSSAARATATRWRAPRSPRAARGADYSLTRARGGRRAPAVPRGGGAAGARGRRARHLRPGARGGRVGARRALGGPRALALAREAWRSDSSYEVRAAALARARPARRPARRARARGLETPSYRDAIQNAAIAAVVQRPDPELVAALARQAGAQPLPAIGAGRARGARGQPGAAGGGRRSMTSGNGCGGGCSRRWRSSSTGPAAVALLREAQPTLTREPARAAVTEAIGRLERRPSLTLRPRGADERC